MDGMYGLTNPQKSIWLTEKHYTTDNNVENIVGVLNFKNKVDIDALKKAINTVVEKNDALRMKNIIKDGKVLQEVQEYKPFDVEVLNILNVEQYIDDFSKTPIDIINDDLYCFEIVVTFGKKIKLLSKFHHLVTDAWSLSLIVSEVINNYDSLIKNVENNQEYGSYIDFIKTEQEYLKSDKYFKDQTYWNDVFNTEPPILGFNEDRTINNTAAARKVNVIDKALSNKIIRFCKNNNISTYCFFLTCLQIYLCIQFNLDEIVIGNPFLNRKNHREKNTVGMFVNTLPIRLKINYSKQIIDLLKENSLLIRSVFKHEQYPYEDILEYVKEKYEINQNLYNVLFSYQNAQDNRKESETEYNTQWIFNKNIASNLEMHIHDRDDEGMFSLVFDYQTAVFSEEFIDLLIKKYIKILNQMLKTPNKEINKIEFTDSLEKRKLMKLYSGKVRNISRELKEKNIYKLIEKTNAKKLDNIAIETENESITYKELFERVDKLAYYLHHTCDVEENENIGIITNKNIDTIIAILAVIKINCTIVPIDDNFPLERKQYMISNAKISKILYTEKLKDEINSKLIDVNYKQYKDSSLDKKAYKYNINNNLYIIFTSGSTGNPKPVAISHKNIINLIMHEINSKDITFDNSKILQFATLSFDVSYQEIFTSMLTSSTLVLISDENKKDNLKLTDYIINKKIDVLFIPPRYLTLLSDNKKIKQLDKTLKHVITAGEQLIINNNIKKMIDEGVVIHNHYGPAETHVATTYTINSDSNLNKIPIGKPIDNTRVYLLDKNNKLCPKNVVGEIYIAGDCVGNGYFKNDKLTAERFVPDVFFKNKIMYKTGDIGELDKDGNLLYLGRNDFQVKINGFRIEIEEIEKKISRIPYIKNVVVNTEEDFNKRPKLVAFIEFSENIDVEYEKFKDDLSENLPQYMIPSKFYLINNLPLNINGKADKRELNKNKDTYKLFVSKVRKALPNNETEAKILKAMQNVLNTKELSIDTDFFEIGGDSLTAIQLQIELSKENIELNTQDIYDYSTARKLAKYIKNKNKNNKSKNIVKVDIEPKEVEIKEKTNILLTGATGFLGIHILNELLNNTTNNVYCIVRELNDLDPTEKLKNKYKYYFADQSLNSLINKRLFVIKGDLIKNKFGMLNAEYEELINKIDIVINVAASVKHYGRRDYNYEHNVVSTKNIIKFAEESQALLNHISTVGIAGNNLVNTNDCFKNSFNENDLKIGQDYKENVYISTKMQAEEDIIEEIKANKLNANIFRVGNLMNRYSDNLFQENKTTNAFQNKMKAIIKWGMFPRNMLDFSFDFTPVDLCADAVIKLALHNEYNKVYHVLNNNELTFKEIFQILNKKGVNIQIIKEDDPIIKKGIDDKWLINDLMLNNKKKIKIDSNSTQQELEKVHFKWNVKNSYYTKVLESILEE